jgi:hypothetical protein
MLIDGYYDDDGVFPFELGDILQDEDGDFGIVIGANYAYVHFFWILNDTSDRSWQQSDTRILTVIEDYKKVGHFDENLLSLLLKKRVVEKEGQK